jgi:Transposase DDE domain group 1
MQLCTAIHAKTEAGPWLNSFRLHGTSKQFPNLPHPRLVVANNVERSAAPIWQKSRPVAFNLASDISAEGFDQKCYEDFYCARGNMENQIKQQYLDLDADRTSTHRMASNQLRLWFSAFALLLTAHFGLAGHRTGSCDCRHDPATITQDWRHGHGQHAPGLHSVRFGLSPSARLRTSISCSVRIGVRRGLRPPPPTSTPPIGSPSAAQLAEPARNRSKIRLPRLHSRRKSRSDHQFRDPRLNPSVGRICQYAAVRRCPLTCLPCGPCRR